MRDELNVDSIGEDARKSRQRWTGNVICRNYNRPPKRLFSSKAEGRRSRGRARRGLLDSVKSDLNERGGLCGGRCRGWFDQRPYAEGY